jgi:UDP-2,3-diacylglucosamine hydrolase
MLARPSFHPLHAPAAWRSVDFISDLHLQESEPANFLAWRRYMQNTPADAVFILGDLFEVWVGDDVLPAHTGDNALSCHEGLQFEERCRRVLVECAQDKALFFICGNRDFLVGSAFLAACSMQALPDPTVLTFGKQQYLLSHGDALCLADTEYQAFRTQVRSAVWQADFLARPLSERLQMARGMRVQSEARKQQGAPWIDVDPAETARWMRESGAQHMVHGHTHEGLDHLLPTARSENSSTSASPGTRHVLCDWHADASPARAQVLRLSCAPGAISSVQRLPV